MFFHLNETADDLGGKMPSSPLGAFTTAEMSDGTTLYTEGAEL